MAPGKLTGFFLYRALRVGAPFAPGAGIQPGPGQAGMDSRKDVVTGGYAGSAVKNGILERDPGTDFLILLH